jgi:hypothetical protein
VRQLHALWPLQAQVDAPYGLALAMACAAGGAVNYTKAGQVFQVQMGYFQNQFPDQQAKLSDACVRVCEARWEGPEPRGMLMTDPKPGRPPKIPDAKAREAAEIIFRGYPVQHTVHQQVVTDVKYFYSVAEAIAYSATLRDTLRDYKATPGAATRVQCTGQPPAWCGVG